MFELARRPYVIGMYRMLSGQKTMKLYSLFNAAHGHFAEPTGFVGRHDPLATVA